MKKRIIIITVISCLFVLLCSAFAFADTYKLEASSPFTFNKIPSFDYTFDVSGRVYCNQSHITTAGVVYPNEYFFSSLSLRSFYDLNTSTYDVQALSFLPYIYNSSVLYSHPSFSVDLLNGSSSRTFFTATSSSYAAFNFLSSTNGRELYLDLSSGSDIHNSDLISFLEYVGFTLVSDPAPTREDTTLMLSNGVLSWAKNFNNYDTYIQRLSSNLADATVLQSILITGNATTYTPTQAGYYRLSFVPTSEASEAFDGFAVKVVKQLPAPTGLHFGGNILYWDLVSNASSYRVKYNNEVQNLGGGSSRNNLQVDLNFSYQIQAVGNDLYLDSEWSDTITYNGSSGTVLAAPVISYNSSTNILSWDSVPNATGYKVFFNGYSLGSQDGTTFNPANTGEYYVQALGNGIDLVSSYQSNTIFVTLNSGIEPSRPDAPSSPDQPDNKNIIEWIKYGIEYIGYIFDSIIYYISYLFDSAVSGIQVLIEYIKQFTLSIGDLFAFVPEEIKRVLISLLFITSLFYLFNLFKK